MAVVTLRASSGNEALQGAPGTLSLAASLNAWVQFITYRESVLSCSWLGQRQTGSTDWLTTTKRNLWAIDWPVSVGDLQTRH